jgi:hypothetical protein
MRASNIVLICGLLLIIGLLSISFLPSNTAPQLTAAPLYTAAFTPEAYVLIDMYELNANGSIPPIPTRCTTSSTKWGCPRSVTIYRMSAAQME